HGVYKRLPTGWVVNPTNQPQPGWTWPVLLLPYIEQGPLYQSLNPNLTLPNGPPNPANTLTQTPLAVFLCPSDSGPGPISPWFNSYAKSNYVCNRALFGP